MHRSKMMLKILLLLPILTFLVRHTIDHMFEYELNFSCLQLKILPV
jgi:hypothetical protein